MNTINYDSSPQLSTAQLLAGIVGPQAASLALAAYPTLTALSQTPIDGLARALGIRSARRLKCALTLAAHLTCEVLGERPMLDTPARAADCVRETCRAYAVETFQALMLDTRRRLIKTVPLASGTLDTILIHPREVFNAAIVARASGLILVHNHPSGDPSPSEADICVTRDLIRAGRLLKIEVLDHVIMGHRSVTQINDFVSLRELGYFFE